MSTVHQDAYSSHISSIICHKAPHHQQLDSLEMSHPVHTSTSSAAVPRRVVTYTPSSSSSSTADGQTLGKRNVFGFRVLQREATFGHESPILRGSAQDPGRHRCCREWAFDLIDAKCNHETLVQHLFGVPKTMVCATRLFRSAAAKFMTVACAEELLVARNGCVSAVVVVVVYLSNHKHDQLNCTCHHKIH